ncbi:related to Don3 interacting protein [Ustilago sp. UG-2017b]|nr:related to Don3 interacting protein [Ustilago sp. UG-2017b]
MPQAILSHSSTPTQSSTRFSTARDHLSGGISRPNNSMSLPRTLNLDLAIEGWLDSLTSPLFTSSERITVLNDIEKTLVKITDSSARAGGLVGLDHSATFWALQATAGYNLAEVLLGHVYRLHLELERADEANNAPLSNGSSSQQQTSATSEAQQLRIRSTTSEICIAITILQGLTLCSRATQRISSRKSCLELLLQIVLADYCTQLLPPILIPAATPTTRPATPNSSTAAEAPLPLPSGFALDLLMCILVNSGVAQERFTDMGGIHQIVQLSHKCADTVTTPASIPASTPTKSSFGDVGRRASYVTALKQTDLLCLEFRYFWSQVLNSHASSGRMGSEEANAGRMAKESTTPKASPRKRASRRDLSGEGMGGGETPKAPRSKRRTTAQETKSIRATSEEAPSRPTLPQQGESAVASPRKLRHSTSVAELGSKPRSSEMPPAAPAAPASPASPAPSLPSCFCPSSSDLLTSKRRQIRPSTSGSTCTSTSAPFPQRTEQRHVRRSTVSEVNPEMQTKYAARPDRSSRDRPRIPSPLKPRTPAQEAAEFEQRQGKQDESTQQQGIPYRRLGCSTTSPPCSLFHTTDTQHQIGRMAGADVENQNPFQAMGLVEKKSPVERVATPPSELFRGSSGEYGTLSASPSRTSLGMMGARAIVPPSPAVRKAQMARARSLSPTKLSLSASVAASRESS